MREEFRLLQLEQQQPRSSSGNGNPGMSRRHSEPRFTVVGHAPELGRRRTSEGMSSSGESRAREELFRTGSLPVRKVGVVEEESEEEEDEEDKLWDAGRLPRPTVKREREELRGELVAEQLWGDN
ncbi:hypothetical protein P7C70_g9242, partial [Phenoliferia sp. Uapishka_3]